MARGLSARALALLLLATPSSAQDAGGGGHVITGRVYDTRGQTLPGSEVSCFAADGTVAAKAQTDTEGSYRLTIPDRRQCASIEAGLGGFIPERIASSRTNLLDFELVVGSLCECFSYGAVSGVVLTEALTPVADASVWVTTPGGSRVGAARTDAQGRFSAELPSFHGPLVVCARAVRATDAPATDVPACRAVMPHDKAAQVMLTLRKAPTPASTEVPFPVLNVTPRSVRPTCVDGGAIRATLEADVAAHNPASYPMLVPKRAWTVGAARSAASLAALESLGVSTAAAAAARTEDAAERPGAVPTTGLQAADFDVVPGGGAKAGTISGAVTVPRGSRRHVMQVLLEPGVRGEPDDKERARLGGNGAPGFRPLWLWRTWSLPFVVELPDRPAAGLPACPAR